MKRCEAFSAHRYEDDLLIVSKCICKHCVEHVVATVYDQELRFEVCDDFLSVDGACCSNKFLDFLVMASFGDISFDLFCVNKDYLMTGVEGNKKKNRFPPPLGEKGTIISRLAANLRSRRQRWTQLGLSFEQAAVAFVNDCQEIGMM
eukprot:4441499-Karenia_brevis.AAC.1